MEDDKLPILCIISATPAIIISDLAVEVWSRHINQSLKPAKHNSVKISFTLAVHLFDSLQ